VIDDEEMVAARPPGNVGALANLDIAVGPENRRAPVAERAEAVTPSDDLKNSRRFMVALTYTHDPTENDDRRARAARHVAVSAAGTAARHARRGIALNVFSMFSIPPAQYMIIGHVAGVAARLAIDAHAAVQDVDAGALCATVRSQRAVFDDQQ
jgi:hypothetical protein